MATRMKDLMGKILAPHRLGDEVRDGVRFSGAEFDEAKSRLVLSFTPALLKLVIEPRSDQRSFQQTASFNLFIPSDGPATFSREEMALANYAVERIRENDPGAVVWKSASTLFLVPGVICNPSDLGMRAIEVLRQVAVILVEPGKEAITRELLTFHNVAPEHPQRIVALPDGESDTLRLLEEIVARDEDLCLFGADEGLPGFSDPGKLMLTAAEQLGDRLRVRCVGGTSALAMALLRVPIDLDHFVFVGVLSDGGELVEALVRRGDNLSVIAFLAEERDAVMRRIAALCAPLGREVFVVCNLTCDEERLVRISPGSDLGAVAPLTEMDRVVLVVGPPRL
ncbi:MAG: SAM-dependent methyltransferase [bacterium]